MGFFLGRRGRWGVSFSSSSAGLLVGLVGGRVWGWRRVFSTVEIGGRGWRRVFSTVGIGGRGCVVDSSDFVGKMCCESDRLAFDRRDSEAWYVVVGPHRIGSIFRVVVIAAFSGAIGWAGVR